MRITRVENVCHDRVYCGAIIFNGKPSNNPIESQGEYIRLLNEYNRDARHIEIHLLPNITKRYMRLVFAVPQNAGLSLDAVYDGMNGMSTEVTQGGVDITSLFTHTSMPLEDTGKAYEVWYYTYATRPNYNNMITFELKSNE